MEKQNPKLTKKTIKEIKRARGRVKEGEFYIEEEAKEILKF